MWRYLDGLDEETRAAVIRKYVPQEQFGGRALKPSDILWCNHFPGATGNGGSQGTAVVSSAGECIDLMKKWEEVRLLMFLRLVVVCWASYGLQPAR